MRREDDPQRYVEGVLAAGAVEQDRLQAVAPRNELSKGHEGAEPEPVGTGVAAMSEARDGDEAGARGQRACARGRGDAAVGAATTTTAR